MLTKEDKTLIKNVWKSRKYGVKRLIKEFLNKQWSKSGVVFWTTSKMRDEKSAAKFHYIKTVSGKVVVHSIAFQVVSIYWQGTTPSP